MFSKDIELSFKRKTGRCSVTITSNGVKDFYVVSKKDIDRMDLNKSDLFFKFIDTELNGERTIIWNKEAIDSILIEEEYTIDSMKCRDQEEAESVISEMEKNNWNIELIICEDDKILKDLKRKYIK